MCIRDRLYLARVQAKRPAAPGLSMMGGGQRWRSAEPLAWFRQRLLRRSGTVLLAGLLSTAQLMVLLLLLLLLWLPAQGWLFWRAFPLALAIGEWLWLVAAMALLHSIERPPVSYTHLDVYKRQILPIVDMRKRFELPPLSAEQLEDYAVRRARKYLIVPIEGRLVGMIVDRVSDVLRVSREAIRPPPLLTQNDNARYFAGVCHHLSLIHI